MEYSVNHSKLAKELAKLGIFNLLDGEVKLSRHTINH